MAGHHEKFYNAKLWSLIHERSRLGISKYMRLGHTITGQSKQSIQRYYKFMRQKFPDGGISDKWLRSQLTTKLIKNKKKLTRESKVRIYTYISIYLSICIYIYMYIVGSDQKNTGAACKGIGRAGKYLFSFYAFESQHDVESLSLIIR